MEILENLITLGPVVTVLVSVIWFLHNKLSKCEERLEKLNQSTRDNDKENILLLESLSSALDKLSDRDDNNTQTILQELRNMRDLVITKLENNSNGK